MGTEWKKSRYAFFIEQENGEMIIYHSTTGFILQCTEPEYIEKAKKIANPSVFEMDEENDLMCSLRDKGVLWENDFDEHGSVTSGKKASARILCRRFLDAFRHCEPGFTALHRSEPGDRSGGHPPHRVRGWIRLPDCRPEFRGQ